MAVSIGQAAVNALADWLRISIASDIVVSPRWPDPAKKLPSKAVTVIKVGSRSRVDATCLSLVSRVDIDDKTTKATFMFGGMTQALQIDVWASNDDDRDDMISQIDDALTAGVEQTLARGQDPIAAGITGDPIRDGVLVPFLAADGYTGNVDCLFDDAVVDDDPQSIQRKEYRATYSGEAQFAYVVTRTVPRMKSTTLKLQTHQGAVAPPGMLSDTYTITPNPSPPPPSKVTHGTST